MKTLLASPLYRLTTLLAFLALAGASLSAAAAITTQHQQFQQPTVIPTGNWPAAIESADLNGDARPDLIYTDFGATPTASTSHILLNNGDGTFTPGQTLSTAGSTLAVADFDKDGHPDLVWVWVVQGLGRVYFAHGNGDGTFAPTLLLGTFAQIGNNLPQLTYILAAQMHDAGPLDLLVEDTANQTLFELTPDFSAGPGSGVLVRLFGIHLPDGTGPMTTADLNGDGHTDLILQATGSGAPAGTIDIFLGTPDGILTTPTAHYSGPNGVHSFLLQDLDADGHPDLLLEATNGHLDLLHGYPDATFATASSGGTTTLDPLTGAGGHLIGIAGTSAAPHLYTATPAGISLLEAQSDLSLRLQGLYNAGPAVANPAASYLLADFNHDGIPDLALDSPEGIAILYANPDGSLQTSRSFSANQPALSGTLGIFSTTGSLDALLATGSTQAQLLHGNGDGTFTTLTAPTSTSLGTANASVLTGDFNGDGILDIALSQNQTALNSTTGSSLSLQYGNGDGTFGPITPIAGTAPGNATTIGTTFATTDSSGDHLFLSAAGTQKNAAYTRIDLTSSSIGSNNLVAAGDLNHDGKADLLYQNGNAWTPYLNIGTSFSPTQNLPGVPTTPGLTAASALIADLDGDGNGDILLAFDNSAADHAHPTPTTANQIYLWYGKGDGTFTAPVVLNPSRNFYQLAATDIDNDGLTDLILSDGYLVGILRNLGNRTFGTETHLLAGAGINSLSTADLNHDGTTDLVVANGGATLSNPAATIQSHAAVNTGGLTVLLSTLDVKAVNGSLTAAPVATPYGQPYIITASLAPATSGPAATGTITFAVDGTPLGTVSIQSGTATITGPGNAPVGKHTITAQYSGDTTYTPAQLNTTHTVTGVATTAVFSMTTPATLFYGQTVDGFATVTAADSSQLTGTITFYDNAASICTIPVTANLNCPASAGAGFTAGHHALTAVYSGDATHAASTSTAVIATILPDPTAATLTTSLNPAPAGQTIALTVTLRGNFATPTGSVTFLDGNAVLGSVTLTASGLATLPISTLTPGTHTITAVYAANLNFNAVTSTVLAQTVTGSANATPTATMVSSSANPATAGQSVTLTANVVATTTSPHIPTGNVTFQDNGTPLGTAMLNPSGLATFNTSTLLPGSHTITALYAGDGTSAASTSPAFTQTVTAISQPLNASFVIGVGSVNVAAGGSMNVAVKVIPLNGFSQAVQLTCSNLPTAASCDFAASTVPVGGGTTAFKLSTMAPGACGSGTSYSQGTNSASLPYTAPVLAGLLLFLLPKRRYAWKGLLTLLAMGGFLALTGCGACTDLGTKPGTYTITVTGTSMGNTPVTVTQKVQITVTP